MQGDFEMPTQVLSRRGTIGGLACCGVSSFGYSGTIAHAVLRCSADGVEETALKAAIHSVATLSLEKRNFAWSEPAHVFAQLRLAPAADAAVTFRSPVIGALHAVVAEHLVQARIVFPGAAYLEMARASCCAAATSQRSHVTLTNVYFLQPLAIETADMEVECELTPDGRFDIRSGESTLG
eukprot:3054009-Prymnesium_polylepis.1